MMDKQPAPEQKKPGRKRKRKRKEKQHTPKCGFNCVLKVARGCKLVRRLLSFSST
jgi:hypothetical protein